MNGNGLTEKNRERLTVYIDRELEARFREDAERNFRSLSDQMVAILTEHYGRKDAEQGKGKK